MNINLSCSPGAIGQTLIRTTPYFLLGEAQLAVDLLLVPVLAVVIPVAGSYTLYMINRSPGAQTIRIGAAPGFAPNFGISLLPTDTYTLWNVTTSLFAIADIAGGLLDCQIWFQI